MKWLIKHALRTMIKEGDPEALLLIGFHPDPDIKVQKLTLDNRVVEFGNSLVFNVKIKSLCEKDQWLMIDYVIHHMKANGKLTPKFFKLKKVNNHLHLNYLKSLYCLLKNWKNSKHDINNSMMILPPMRR